MVSGEYETFIYLARQHKPAGGASHYITNPQSRGQPAGQGPARCLSSSSLRPYNRKTGEVARKHEVTSELEKLDKFVVHLLA